MYIPSAMKRILVIAFLWIFGKSYTIAQSNILGFNNPFLSQSTAVNPAFIPQFGTTISFGTSLAAYYPNFSLGDFFSKSTSVKQDIDSFLSRDNKQLTNIEIQNRVELLHLGFRSRRAYLTMNTAVVTNIYANIDKDLLGIAFYGNDENSPYFGKRVDIDLKENQGTVVWENRITYGRTIRPWLNVGAVLTNYNGLYRYNVKQANFGVYSDTSNDHIYKWKVDGVWDIQTNGIRNLNPMGPMDYVNAGPFINMGQSAGFGVIIRPSKKYRISASFNNFGSIGWDYETYNHNLTQTSWYFSGLDSNSWAKGNGEQINSNLRDSVNKYFVTESKTDWRWGYSFPFKPTWYLGFEYFINPKNRISFQYSTANGVLQNKTFFAVQSQNRIGKRLDVMSTYAKYDLKNPQDIFGIGLSTYWRHYQVSLMANNVKGLIQLDKSHYHSINLSVAILFTENIDSDGDNVPDHKDNCKDLYGNIRYRGCPENISSTPYIYDPEYQKLKKLEDVDDRFELTRKRRKRNRWQF